MGGVGQGVVSEHARVLLASPACMLRSCLSVPVDLGIPPWVHFPDPAGTGPSACGRGVCVVAAVTVRAPVVSPP